MGGSQSALSVFLQVATLAAVLLAGLAAWVRQTMMEKSILDSIDDLKGRVERLETAHMVLPGGSG